MGLPQEIFFEKVGYKPHKRQWEYHKSTARYTAPVCGRRFGKSTMAGRKLGPHLFEPNKRFWIVGPTYDLGEKEFRVVWDDLMIKLGLGKDKRIKKAFNKAQGDMYIEFPWHTRLEVRSADNAEHLVGEALDGVVMSESAKHKEETWNRYIRPALSDRRGWATFPTTPEGQNWLYEIWLLGQSNDPVFKDYESWRFPSWENTALYGDEGFNHPEIQQLLLTMPKDSFEQEIAADFTTFVGKIYPEFDERVHVISDYTFNPLWKNYLMFDFGYVNPLCALDVQIDPWDNVYVWREHYLSYQQLDTHINMIKNREQPSGYHIDLAFGDAADPASVDYISQKLVGCVADPKSKDNWREGVDLVKTFLEVREVQALIVDEAGQVLSEAVRKPRLFVSKDCANTIKEFANYRAPQTSGSRLNRRSPRETAQSINDHALDALRYGLMHIYKLGAYYHLSDVSLGSANADSGRRSLETSMGNAMLLDGPTSERTEERYFSMSMEF